MAGKRWQRAFDDPIPLPIKSQDISPGGLSWPEFQKDMLAAQENSRTMGDEEMCVAAAAMVGPDGVVARDLMVPKEGQPLLAGGRPVAPKPHNFIPLRNIRSLRRQNFEYLIDGSNERTESSAEAVGGVTALRSDASRSR